MTYSLFANITLLANAAEEVNPAGTPIWVPIVIIVILLLVFLWGLTRNSIPEGTAVHPTENHDAHEHTKSQTVEAVAVEPDDLKIIEGIGPKINSILQAAGINTFADLAAVPVTELEKIVRDDAGVTIAFPDTWPEQSALARDGKWDDLEQLQDDLKGGRRA